SLGSAYAAYPEKPIKLIVPFSAGGPTDVVARSLADVLGRHLGQPIVVENKPGAGGSLGSAQLSRATPDGYTLGVAAVSTHVVNPACNNNISYNPVKDFTHIALVADMPMIWAMQPKMKEKNFEDIVNLARTSSQILTQGTAGMCTLQHMLVEKFNDRLKTKIQGVPYQGSAPAMNDFLGGNLNLIMDVAYLVQPLVTTGKAKPFAVISENRLEALPDVPTIEELGYKDLNFRPWYGIVAPKGLPEEITQKLIAAIDTSMADKKLLSNFKTTGMNPVINIKGQNFSNKIQKEFEDNKAFASMTSSK
ncbi:MAG: Bug family tripartite tricarboxylate transporter substrate binding protein, partial [Comamonas sp.]